MADTRFALGLLQKLPLIDTIAPSPSPRDLYSKGPLYLASEQRQPYSYNSVLFPRHMTASHCILSSPLRLLLGSGGLGGLFPVTPHHDQADEGAHDGGPEDDEEDRDADGPDARGKKRVEDVVVVNEGLRGHVSHVVRD